MIGDGRIQQRTAPRPRCRRTLQLRSSGAALTARATLADPRWRTGIVGVTSSEIARRSLLHARIDVDAAFVTETSR